MQNIIMTEEEVRNMLGVSRTTFWRMRRDGSFPVKPLRPNIRTLRYKRADVEHWATQPTQFH